MKLPSIKLLLLTIVCSLSASKVSFAQQGGTWERAFARPHGAILIDEILFEPERFVVRFQDQEIRVAGRFLRPDVSFDGFLTAAPIVWNRKSGGVLCLSSDREEMTKVVDLVPGEEVLATGTVARFDGFWVYLEDCRIESGVTLFHDRDPKFILGTWCSVYGGLATRKYTFTRGDKGQYLVSTSDPDRAGGWRVPTSPMQARIKRVSPTWLETILVGPKHDFGRDRFTIVSHNQMSRGDGFQFHRCR